MIVVQEPVKTTQVFTLLGAVGAKPPGSFACPYQHALNIRALLLPQHGVFASHQGQSRGSYEGALDVDRLFRALGHRSWA